MGRGQQGMILALIIASLFGGVIAACYWLAGPSQPAEQATAPAPVVAAQGPAGVVSATGPISGPAPLLAAGKPVDWWVVFKFNSANFPGCDGSYSCPFGGTRQHYRSFSQQYAYASSAAPTLAQGGGCVGTSAEDPVGATFGAVYNGAYNYVIWNDQFYDDPVIAHCQQDCGSPWGHSKGMVAWNDAGEGMVMQVSTPSWPGAGSAANPRQSDGNTLGCVKDNDVLVSQHFFATRLQRDDLLKVLQALQNASVVTNPNDPQIVHNGGPRDVQALVAQLGRQVKSRQMTDVTLSNGIELIAKPAQLHVPPWQLVSAALDGTALRVASWWARPKIPSTAADTPIGCWDNSLGQPGPVEIATTGQWQGVPLGLTGGQGENFNHAKIGVGTSGAHHYAIFGDMNQQGTLNGPNCDSSQNGRGGMFFVVDNPALAASVGQLLQGNSGAE